MAYFGFSLLVLAFALTVLGTMWALIALFVRQEQRLPWVEKCQWVVFALVLGASLILLWALGRKDFSFRYVAEYTDSFLPWYYSLTAFWAGQEGSFLFWGLVVSLLGVIFLSTKGYQGLEPRQRIFFCLFYLGIEAFFWALLGSVSNPFVSLAPVPADGNGLNPLLQNAGMIFHPPLLFLGYAGFTVPACLGLSAVVAGGKGDWLLLSRNWLLLSWIFLSAGIVLGSWWSYFELGWGGYWAWDPVENSSLIPWLVSSALVHTALLGRRFKVLEKTNFFLLQLTLILCFFSTFLTRSGVLNSLHAFGEGSLAWPLLVFMIFLAVLALCGGWLGLAQREKASRSLGDIFSRQGVVVILSWCLLALALVITMATLWPLLSKTFFQQSIGLDQGFYNRVCLPFFSLIFFLLAFCPWLDWRRLRLPPKFFFLVLAVFAFCLVGLYLKGIVRPLPLFAAVSSLAGVFSLVLKMLSRFASFPRMKRGVYGLHVGLALMGLGVAISGPYQRSAEFILNKGQTATLGGYEIIFKGLETYTAPGMQGVRARVEVQRGKDYLGELIPERRLYVHFDQPFSEVSVLPSLGNELYATLLGFTQNDVARLQVKIIPLVNWIWIGAIVLCAAGLFALDYRRKDRLLAGNDQ